MYEHKKANNIHGDLWYHGLHWIVVNKKTDYIIAFCRNEDDSIRIAAGLNIYHNYNIDD